MASATLSAGQVAIDLGFGPVTLRDQDVLGTANQHGGFDGDRLFLLINVDCIMAGAYAGCEQDALDTIADSGKLRAYEIVGTDLEELIEREGPDGYDESFATLGNDCGRYDVEYFSLMEIPVPPVSLAALLTGAHGTDRYGAIDLSRKAKRA